MGRSQKLISSGRYLVFVKLCRFELLEEPEQIRSGIYFDGKIYETDGINPIGVHELDRIRLFPPLGHPPVLRLFDTVVAEDGTQIPYYSYANPMVLTGPNSEITLPAQDNDWDFEVRVCGVVGDRGEQIDAVEAPSFIIGYSLMLVLKSTRTSLEATVGYSHAGVRDYGIAIGPFLVTPDDVADSLVEGETSLFRWPYEIYVNDEVIARGVNECSLSFADLLVASSANSAVYPGEIIAFPPLEKQPIDLTSHGRGLLPTDKVAIRTDALGILVARFA